MSANPPEVRKSLDAETIIKLLANVALPGALQLIDLFYSNGEVTVEVWMKLREDISTPFDTMVPKRTT